MTQIGLDEKAFAYLNQITVDELRSFAWEPDHFFAGIRNRYKFEDALTLEIARQLSDNSGVTIKEALRLITYTNAVNTFARRDPFEVKDFWLAVLSSRNTWGSEPRGSWPVTGFGEKEYWSELHFTGPLAIVVSEISEWIARDLISFSDSDPARIIMANVSTADRRLRKRAAEIGIAIVGDEFEIA